ncbi:MAG: asparagine synthase (glutamine-hydrolyzing) [Desulfovibrionaceae bacterium]|nr:asparagine synthase (glutamine-hydrolyzing) [Desulfovibrionaceae bacterium]
MCGITGVFSPHESIPAEAGDALRAMAESLAHRGPDASGVWLDPEAGCGLGHRRLSIIELSPLGGQPMVSSCGRYVLVFNGEVYNFKALRRELEALGRVFRGGSDTEVALEAVAHWGLEQALERFVGMFALAVWDRGQRVLRLARDRLGIKPLYYGWTAGRKLFVFGSELKALKAWPGFDNQLDRDALALFFRYGYVPGPHSIYREVSKLMPGRVLSLGKGEAEPRIRTYWSAEEVWSRGAARPFAGTEAEAVDGLEALLKDSVALRMIADVPLGAFLSGGVDSSLVVALMQAQSSRPVRTFSIGFKERRFNEADHARAVAGYLGAEHTELCLSPQDLLEVVPDMPRHWDEPFADSSQIPTFCVSRLARQGVTVSLSGDGGDELFNGYDRYHFIDRVWRLAHRVPRTARKVLAATGKALPESLYLVLGRLGPKIRWRLDALGCKDFQDFYRYLFSHHRDPARFVLGAREPQTAFTRPLAASGLDRYQVMSLLDLLAYLPDDILTKVDRASMAVGLEARVPILDHRVVELAACLPTTMKVKAGRGKWVLRQVLYRHLPRQLVDRPKMGFGVPVEDWLAKDLREWCESLLDPAMIRAQGFLDVDEVGRMWRGYLGGQKNWCHQLWDVLMFQAWLGANDQALGGRR